MRGLCSWPHGGFELQGRLVVSPDGWHLDIWVKDVQLKDSLLLQNWKSLHNSFWSSRFRDQRILHLG